MSGGEVGEARIIEKSPTRSKTRSSGVMTHRTLEPCEYMLGDRQKSGGDVPGASWEISQQHKCIRAQVSHGSLSPEPALHESIITRESF